MCEHYFISVLLFLLRLLRLNDRLMAVTLRVFPYSMITRSFRRSILVARHLALNDANRELCRLI